MRNCQKAFTIAPIERCREGMGLCDMRLKLRLEDSMARDAIQMDMEKTFVWGRKYKHIIQRRRLFIFLRQFVKRHAEAWRHVGEEPIHLGHVKLGKLVLGLAFGNGKLPIAR